MRLDKYLAQMSKGTRSEVKKFIKSGRVFVNGIPAVKPEQKVTEEDNVELDGERVFYEEYVYYMLNKPQGVVSATKDNICSTVLSLIRDSSKKNIFPVGRLDKDTEGLLIITNDGALSHDLLAPGKHVWKTYFVRVRGILEDKEISCLENGLDIGEEKPTRPAKVRLLKAEGLSLLPDDPGYPEDGQCCLELSICEGRFHQVKRMLAAVGHPVLYLKRLSMGSLQLDESLAPGEYRRLTGEEIDALREDGDLYEKKSVYEKMDI